MLWLTVLNALERSRETPHVICLLSMAMFLAYFLLLVVDQNIFSAFYLLNYKSNIPS